MWQCKTHEKEGQTPFFILFFESEPYVAMYSAMRWEGIVWLCVEQNDDGEERNISFSCHWKKYSTFINGMNVLAPPKRAWRRRSRSKRRADSVQNDAATIYDNIGASIPTLERNWRQMAHFPLQSLDATTHTLRMNKILLGRFHLFICLK